jgi:hypothetical protein
VIIVPNHDPEPRTLTSRPGSSCLCET